MQTIVCQSLSLRELSLKKNPKVLFRKGFSLARMCVVLGGLSQDKRSDAQRRRLRYDYDYDDSQRELS